MVPTTINVYTVDFDAVVAPCPDGNLTVKPDAVKEQVAAVAPVTTRSDFVRQASRKWVTCQASILRIYVAQIQSRVSMSDEVARRARRIDELLGFSPWPAANSALWPHHIDDLHLRRPLSP